MRNLELTTNWLQRKNTKMGLKGEGWGERGVRMGAGLNWIRATSNNGIL